MLIDSGNKEKRIKELLYRNETKTVFLKEIKKKIARAINFKMKKENSSEYKTLSDFSYGHDDLEIRKILLLFNVEALIRHNKENARFPFHL